MRLFLRYLKSHRKIMLILPGFAAVFVLVFAMYRLPVRAALYPALLCAALGGLCMAADFAGVRRKHLLLTQMQKLPAAMLGDFDGPSDITEEDYQKIIRALQRELAELEETSNLRYRDMVDYYTVWAHQIKTPIASMRLTLQNEDTPLSRRLQGELFRIEQYAEMVLTYLRLGSDTSDYVFREHSVDALVRQAVKKFSHEFIDRRLELQYQPVEKTIVTDDKWFGFVLEQVLSNALKYTREGGIRIYPAGTDALCIEDTGIGIAPEDLPRIFQNGYTGCNGRTDKKASGIGLYLCKRVCENLGIDISAESEAGKGTTVKIGLEQYRLRRE